MVLPNRNANKAKNKQDSQKTGKNALKITEQEKTVISYIEKNGSVDDDALQELLDIKQTRAYVLMKKMKEKGLITSKGRGVNKKYYLSF